MKNNTLAVVREFFKVEEGSSDSWEELMGMADAILEGKTPLIPKGWEVFPAEEGNEDRRDILTNIKGDEEIPFSRRFRRIGEAIRGHMSSGPNPDPSLPFEVGKIQISGPLQMKRKGDMTEGMRGSILIWSDGEIETLRNYERGDVVYHQGEGDYCCYCGGFNGERGELRQGWDCYFCGGC